MELVNVLLTILILTDLNASVVHNIHFGIKILKPANLVHPDLSLMLLAFNPAYLALLINNLLLIMYVQAAPMALFTVLLIKSVFNALMDQSLILIHLNALSKLMQQSTLAQSLQHLIT